ncbi:MAG: sensor histidine kinase [Nitrospinae bacterium]|nr:sensor histidine kinase [Nitrospinota bacterium]
MSDKRLEAVLKKNRETVVREWTRLLRESSEAYRRRPDFELRENIRASFDASMAFMFRNDRAPLHRQVTQIVERRLKAKFSVTEVQTAIEIFRTVTRPMIIAGVPRERLNDCLAIVDDCVSYSIRLFSEKYQAQQELDARYMNQALTETLSELKQEKDNAMAANVLKDEFLANVSHELKTPLTSIIGFSKILMDTGGEQMPGKEKLRIIYEQGRALLRMINTLLLISEINSGMARLSRDAVAMKDIAELAVQNIKKLKIAEEHPIRFAVADDLPIIIGDSEKLVAVVFELILNGLKFSEPGSEVAVDCRPQNGGVAISVRDYGIGMDVEATKRIFSPFFQLDGSITRKFGGNGLGLTMIQKVVELHNGKVSVESHPGKGTTFTVELPVIQK